MSEALGPSSAPAIAATKTRWVDWNLLKDSLNKIGRGLWSYFPYILIVGVIAYMLYYVYSYFYELRRRYNCFSWSNFFRGKLGQCFNQPPEYCKDIDPDLNWGWCMDPDYYGAYAGNIDGPYGITCNRWIASPKKCPPMQCKGAYPIGLQINEKNTIQRYGWCADPEVNKALRGTYCGPSPDEGVQCKQWIWEEPNCPQTCPKGGQPSSTKSVQKTATAIVPSAKTAQVIKSDCSMVCGIKDGKQIPCPPADCQAKPEQCPCK